MQSTSMDLYAKVSHSYTQSNTDGGKLHCALRHTDRSGAVVNRFHCVLRLLQKY